LAERITVLDDNKMPGLTVSAASRQASCLDNPPDDIWRHGFILIGTHSQPARTASKTSIVFSF
jgi:hypothetical protein